MQFCPNDVQKKVYGTGKFEFWDQISADKWTWPTWPKFDPNSLRANQPRLNPILDTESPTPGRVQIGFIKYILELNFGFQLIAILL